MSPSTLQTNIALNRLHHSGSVVYIECRNTPMVSYVTASAESIAEITSRRWRVINGECLTTVPHGLYEVKATLQHAVTRKTKTTIIRFRNGNPLDCRLSNLVLPWSKTMSTVEVRNGHGILVLESGREILLDIEDVPFVELYNWTSSKRPNGVSIYHYQPLPDRTYRRVFLPRYLMGLDTNAKRQTVIHQNGNPLDCRRNNLRVVER